MKIPWQNTITQSQNWSWNQNSCWHRLMSGMKHHLKISWNKHITLLINAFLYVPVCLQAQKRAKFSSLQLMANCITARRCLQHYIIWEWPTTEGTNFEHHWHSFLSKLKSEWTPVLTATTSFPSLFNRAAMGRARFLIYPWFIFFLSVGWTVLLSARIRIMQL